MQLSSAQFAALVDREITQIQFSHFATPDKYKEAWYEKIEPILAEWEATLAAQAIVDEIPF